MAIKRYSGDRFTGLSSDTKPTGVEAGAIFTETDTNTLYQFDGSSWNELAYASTNHTHTESDITDLGNYAVVGHSHSASDITSGTLADARMPSSYNNSNWDTAYDRSVTNFTRDITDAGELIISRQGVSNLSVQLGSIHVGDARQTGDFTNSDGSSSYMPNPNDGQFDSGLTPIFSQDWAGPSYGGIITTKGWTSDYAAWQIAGPAGTGASNAVNEFYVRSGDISAWNAWERIYTDAGGTVNGNVEVNGYVVSSGTTPSFRLLETDTTDQNIWMLIAGGNFQIQQRANGGGFTRNLLNIGVNSSDVLVHSGNFSSYGVPVSGGTFTGNVKFNNDSHQVIEFDRTANGSIAHRYSIGISTSDGVMIYNLTDSDPIAYFRHNNIQFAKNVGVGTSPSATFHVLSSNFEVSRFYRTGTSNPAIILGNATNGGLLTVGGLNSGDAYISPQGANGYLGIGTTSPSQKLDVAGNMKVDAGTNTTIHVVSDDGGRSRISLYGASQGTGQLFVGQSTSYGGGIEYNGDGSPATTGAGSDYITLYRVDNGTWNWTARNKYNSNNWEFRGNITANAGTFNGSVTVSGTNSLHVGGTDGDRITIKGSGDQWEIYPRNDRGNVFEIYNRTVASWLWKLDRSGNVTANNFIATSDARIKSNEHHIMNALHSLRNINTYTFEKSGELRAGYFAQNVEKWTKGIVTQVDMHGYKDFRVMDTMGMQAYNTAAIKELDRAVISNEQRIKQLEKELKQLRGN